MGVPSWFVVPADCSAVARAAGLVLSFEDVGSSLSFQLLPACPGAASRRLPGPSSFYWSDSSLGVVQRSPPSTSALRVHSQLRGLANEVRRLRLGVATPRTRSVLAVPPGFDGFLRASPCRFVAPCSRPWGSLRFRFFHRFSSARSGTSRSRIVAGGVRRQPRQVAFTRLPAHPAPTSRRVATPSGLRGFAHARLPAVPPGLAGPKTCLAIGCSGRLSRVRPGASPFP